MPIPFPLQINIRDNEAIQVNYSPPPLPYTL